MVVYCACYFAFLIVTREATTQPPPTTIMKPGKAAFSYLHMLSMIFIVLALLMVTSEAVTQPPPPTTMKPGRTGSFCGVLIFVMTVYLHAALHSL